MKKWLTSFFLLFALLGGVAAGTPVFSGNNENGMSAMKCCQKKSHLVKSMSAAQLCCLLNCGNPAPDSPGASFNFSPSTFVISDSILKQITLLLKKEKPVSVVFRASERKIFSPKFQPKYIQHHSILI